MNYFRSEGRFRGRPVSWRAKTIPSGAVAVSVTVEITADDAGNYCDGVGGQVVGDFFVVKATGAPNEKVCAMLCDTVGWGGTMAELAETPPLDAEIEVEVEARDYKGKTYHQIRWLSPIGGRSKADASPVDLPSLDAKHGAALAAFRRKDGAKPRPAPAPKPAAKPQQQQQQQQAEPDYGDIPF
jgi:hypothetical protein